MKKKQNPSETMEHLLGEAYWLMISLQEMRDRLNLLIENQQKLMKELQAKLKS